MAVWDANKCGYCDTTGLVNGQPRAQYTCSKCQRSGCPTCMPDAETKQCPGCDVNDISGPLDSRLIG